jgi:hypothetical protein
MNGEAACPCASTCRFPARGVSAYTPMPAKPVKGYRHKVWDSAAPSGMTRLGMKGSLRIGVLRRATKPHTAHDECIAMAYGLVALCEVDI